MRQVIDPRGVEMYSILGCEVAGIASSKPRLHVLRKERTSPDRTEVEVRVPCIVHIRLHTSI